MLVMTMVTIVNNHDGDDFVDYDVDGDKPSQITMQDTLGMHCTPDDGLLVPQR